MHLAVCDDHIADRKQMERLLGRESDRRIPTTGVLYIDYFGSRNSLLYAPMIYDALFLDMTEDGCDAIEIAHKLRADGTAIPIVFCCGKVNYRESLHLPDNVYFLDKPIQVDELTATIDLLLELKSRQVKKLEFRNRLETFYLQEEEILYASTISDRDMKLVLIDGSEHTAEITLDMLCRDLVKCDCFILLANQTIINMQYVKEISFFKVTLQDGTHMRLALGEKKSLEKAIANYKAQIADNS